MRHTEFWDRMDAALGSGYSRAWAEQHSITELGSRTVVEALAAGEQPKQVWLAVWRTLGLSPRER